MPKIKALIRIENDHQIEEIETNAIIQDNIFKYKEKDNTTMIIDYEEQVLIRENESLRLEIPFSKTHKTIGNIYLKDVNKNLSVEVETEKFKRKNNDIELKYRLEDQLFLYHVEEIK